MEILPKLEPITILMTNFNRLHFLKKAVKLINERTFYPFNLIVIDNNSTDGSREWLKHEKVLGNIMDHVLLSENIGQSRSLNEGFKRMEEWTEKIQMDDIFVTTNEDIFPPMLGQQACWLRQMLHLFIKNEPEYGGLAMRIQRSARMEIDENEEIIPLKKSFPNVFRMARLSDMKKLGDKPFGRLMKWDSRTAIDNFTNRLCKKVGLTTKIYANHVGFMEENKGFERGFTDYFTYASNKVNASKEKPYPTIDERTNVPIKINHGVDKPEHQKRLDYWGIDTGVQSEGETKRKGEQRYELGQYCATHGGKWADLGCGSEKCHKDEIGIDTYPLSAADIIHTTEDLWFFKDEELDGITSCHHLEHVGDVKKTLREWNRTLKKGGIMATIVPDGQFRPSTIREESHKSAFTMEVIKQLFYRVLGHKILRLEHVPNIAERKKSIICVSKKR